MPMQKTRLVDRCVKLLVKFHHQFGNPLLRRRNSLGIGGQAKLATDGGLDTFAIQNLTFDLRGFHGLLAHHFHSQQIPFLIRQMRKGS